MAVITVDFTKNRRGETNVKNVKTPVTFCLVDGVTKQEMSIVSMIDAPPDRITVEDVIRNLPTAKEQAELEFAANIYDLDAETERSQEDILNDILIDDIFLGTLNRSEVRRFVVSGIKVGSDYAETSSRLIFGANAVDAELQSRITEALDQGLDLTIDFDDLVTFIEGMACEEVEEQEPIS